MNEGMSRDERISAVVGIIEDRIDAIVREYDLTIAELVGILEVIKFGRLDESFNRDED